MENVCSGLYHGFVIMSKLKLAGRRQTEACRLESFKLDYFFFNVAIQDSMEWLDYHLHDFDILDISQKQKPLRIECPFAPPEYNEYGPNVFYTTDVPLKMFLKND